jgi:hypothetical protein
MVSWWIGLDLGKLQNPSALAIAEREVLMAEDGRPLRTATGAPCSKLRIRSLKRFPLGEAYEEVARVVGNLMKRPDLPGIRLAVDCTGVGIGILERIDREVPIQSRVYPVIVTAGEHPNRKDRYWHVPKRTLAGSLRAMLEASDIVIASELEFATALRQELLSFEVRINNYAHEQFEAKPGDYDDLVIACALITWLPTWLESQTGTIVGPGPKIQIEPRPQSAAFTALTMGGRWVRPSGRDPFGREVGGSDDWRPIERSALAWRGSRGQSHPAIFGADS